MFDFATTTAPAARKRVTTVASNGLTYPSRIRDPHDVGSVERGDVVLDDDRNAGQRADGTALRARLVTANLDQRGVGERRLAIEVQQRVEPFASQPGSGHPIQRAQNRIDRGESGLHRFAQRGRRITITRRRTHVSSSS